MTLVRRVASLGRVARKSAGLRVRQPLGRMLVAASQPAEREALLDLQDELLDELNVKSLVLLDGSDGTTLQRYRVKPNLRLLGPRLGKSLPTVRAALEELESSQAATVAQRCATGDSIELTIDGELLTFAAEELLVETLPLDGYVVAQEGGLQVALDTRLDDNLRREGLARDLVRAVQEARKQAGLALSDRIALYVTAEDRSNATDLDATLATWGDYVRAETLAVELHTAAPPAYIVVQPVDLGGTQMLIAVDRQQDSVRD